MFIFCRRRRSRARKREEAQGLVEYALLLVLVAVVVIAVLTLMGGRIGAVFSSIVQAFSFKNPRVTCNMQTLGAGLVDMEAVVSDPQGNNTVSSVRFYLDGSLIRTEYHVSYCLGSGNGPCTNGYHVPSGNHTISAVATDADGNMGQCAVNVSSP
jgi:pilus assembly protein Flp/PilA